MDPRAGDAREGATDLVRTVSELWCEVLGLPSVNPSDNFFDLGGHSLLLHTVRDGLHRRLGRDVPLVDLFQHPTVRSLAAHLAAAASGGPADTGGGRLARLEARRTGRRVGGRDHEETEEW
ncbi:acyl carrier protein [Streptomyces caatingaensis]|uniref:Carrier domain-containing protein n=1 Tax=Streptomyces caatingaensis TaxID=1678637 RepID=A0A0K9XGJ9_9ACTN|nr:acyl carrier protein [Streptomyces caatingaensis]KNB52176.1 hypothetical protein AC230_11485 [Streptomyces caatingaensis]